MVTPLVPLKWYKKLATSKGRLEGGACIVEGEKAIRQIIATHPEKIIEILTTENPPPTYFAYPTRLLTESQLNSICQTKTPQGILAVIQLPEDIYTNSLPENTGGRILLMEDIQDPGNAGTLIRTAAAFDFSGAIMTAGGADPLSPKCVQASAGTLSSIWLRRTAGYLELIQKLKDSGYRLIAAEVNGRDSPSILADLSRFVLALGNEAAGLSEALLEKADYRVRVPIAQLKAQSLNVAACGAILMYLSLGNL
jgi:TrmH family RNA methyltransferase